METLSAPPTETPEPQPAPPAYPGPGGALWLVVLMILGSGVGYALVHVLRVGEVQWLAVLASAAAPTLLVGWYGLRRRGAPLTSLLRFPRLRLPFVPALALGMLGFWIVLGQAFALVTQAFPVPPTLVEHMEERFGGPWLPMTVVLVVAAWAEEVLFRGVILAGLLERYAARPAILMGALVFAAAHVIPWVVFTSFWGGLLLGWLYWRTRSVLLCSAVHAAHNLLSGGVMTILLERAGLGEHSLNQSVLPVLPFWMVAAGVALAVAGFAWSDRELRGVRRGGGGAFSG